MAKTKLPPSTGKNKAKAAKAKLLELPATLAGADAQLDAVVATAIAKEFSELQEAVLASLIPEGMKPETAFKFVSIEEAVEETVGGCLASRRILLNEPEGSELIGTLSVRPAEDAGKFERHWDQVMSQAEFEERLDSLVNPKPKQQQLKPNPATVADATVVAPLYHEALGTPRRRVDVQSLTMEQRGNLQRLMNGLLKKDAELRDGTAVRTEQSAIKWLLEQMTGGDQ